MDSESPPRKKLKQARLPFQILSHKESSPDAGSSTSSRKRQLSDDSHDGDAVVVKVVKKSEESGKTEEIVSPPQKAKDVEDEKCSETSEPVCLEPNVSPTKNDSPHGDKDKENTESKEGSILQSKMKSTLANLFGKKVFDVTAEVGSCDCGCEEANSDDEALEEYMEHCTKGKAGQSKPAKKPRSRSKKKEDGTPEGTTSKPSPKTKSPRTPKSPKAPKNPKKKNEDTRKSIDNATAGKSNEKSPKKSADEVTLTSKVAESSENKEESKVELNKASILSQKAHDMFAKWRKESNIGVTGTDGTTTSSVKDEVKTVSNSPLKSNGGVKPETVKTLKREQSEEKLKSSIKEEKFEVSDAEKPLQPKPCESNELREMGVKKGAQETSAAFEKSIKQGRTSSEQEDQSADSGEALTGEKELSGTPVVNDVEKPSGSLTPTSISKTPQRRLTPKQLERQKEMARKHEERERLKLERESEKKRLKLEKDEQKKKEKEEKEEQRRKEKEEKEKKKQAEQEQKNEEKKKKAEGKAEEKRKKEEEKRKAEEDEERKKAKASALFTSFFVPKSSKNDREETPSVSSTVQNFMPFEVKADMRIAPRVRLTLTSPQKRSLDELLGADCDRHSNLLYLSALKSGKVTPNSSLKTWPVEETKEEDDICILESNDAGALIPSRKKQEKMRAKFLQFHENHRPAYRGTWRKKSHSVTGRRPYGKDQILDYEVDSADEWEEEEPGESLHGSDDEKEQESEDEYEVDNTVFVPHGYLSDDEGDGDENEDILSPETQKAKLKLLGEEFEAQMKSKTSALKPIIIVLTAALQASSIGSARYQKLFERRAVWREDEGPINLFELGNDSESIEGQSSTSDPNCVTFSTGPGAKKKLFSDEALPALITLIHGNQNKRVFLTNEFSAFLTKSGSVESEDADNDPTADKSEGSVPTARPTTPSTSVPNPWIQKWPGLPPASRISISNKIKEIASWGPCPEEGPMLNRQCWYVAEELRDKYGLTNLKIPNNEWIYTLKPKLFKHSQSPNAAANISNGGGADSRALITKFTKVMTPEEKQRQWESMKSSASKTPSSLKQASTKGSAGKITSFAQYARTPSSAESKEVMKSQPISTTPTSSSQPQTKKRVPLLVSVPRGQQISSSSSHCSLLSKFEASISPQSSVPAPKTLEDSTKEKNEDCIVLD